MFWDRKVRNAVECGRRTMTESIVSTVDWTEDRHCGAGSGHLLASRRLCRMGDMVEGMMELGVKMSEVDQRGETAT